MTRTLLLASVAGLLAFNLACGGKEDDSTDVPAPVPETEPTETADTSDDGPGYLEVAGFFFYTQFGVDDNSTVIEATQDGGALSSIFAMTFGDSSFSEYCSVTVDLVGQTNAAFSADIGAWFGMEVDMGDGVTDCDNLDPSYDIVAAWGSYAPMQVYITSAPNTDAADALASYYGITAEYAVGASVLSEVLPYADDSLAGAAYQLDDAFEIVPDDSGYAIPILAYTVPKADGLGGVNRAFYQLNAWSSWTFN